MPSPPCSRPGCPNGRDCTIHAADTLRGSAASRGYNSKRYRGHREAVLKRDPICTCDAADHDEHEPGRCLHLSTVADHHPVERRDLVKAGVRDPDTPDRMRGLCARCHNRKTAATHGGWSHT